MAALIALKYRFLERLVVARSEGKWEERAFHEAEWNSFLIRERRGDHHGFEQYEGLLVGVWEVRREVRRARCRSNQASRESLVERGGRGGTANSLSRGSRAGQAVRVLLGEVGEERRTAVRGWSGWGRGPN